MRRRRAIVVLVLGTVLLALLGGAMPSMIEEASPASGGGTQTVPSVESPESQKGTALAALEELAVKGRAPKTGYERTQFGNGWAKVNGCSTRDIILYRDLENVVLDGECIVKSGTLNDQYTGQVINFSREKSAEVQIDHIVALSDAWQKGAQNITPEMRKQLANDPLNLLSVSGKENQTKSDSDASSWLPKNKAFRCMYVARQIAVKQKYALWVTESEKQSMSQVLTSCLSEPLPG